MQQIERYGVIALVFLLVTIVAISFWGDSKSPGFWSRLTGKNQPKKEEVATIDPQPIPPVIADPNLPLSPATPQPGPQQIVTLGGQPESTVIDQPATGQVQPLPPETVSLQNDILTARPEVVEPPVADPRPIAKPTTVAGTEYVVQRGDSLARIAKNRLGAESRWQEIAALNPNVDPKALGVGQKLLLPQGASKPVAKSTPSAAPKSSGTPTVAKKSTKPAAASGRACIVQKGDTLRSIARRELGDERRWKEIASANPGLDPAKLAIGQRVKLPQKEVELIAAAAGPSVAATKKPRVQ